MTISVLAEPESERELARLGIRWRGYTEAIARVDDVLPAGFPVCLRVLGGLQGDGDPDSLADGFLQRDRQALTRGILREMGRGADRAADRRPEPAAARAAARRVPGGSVGAVLGQLLGRLRRHDRGRAARPGDPGQPSRPGGRGGGPVWWRPPSTIWDVGGSWVMVSYTDSPSAYVGLTRAYPGLIEQLGLPAVCWAERADRIDDWMAPLPGER